MSKSILLFADLIKNLFLCCINLFKKIWCFLDDLLTPDVGLVNIFTGDKPFFEGLAQKERVEAAVRTWNKRVQEHSEFMSDKNIKKLTEKHNVNISCTDRRICLDGKVNENKEIHNFYEVMKFCTKATCHYYSYDLYIKNFTTLKSLQTNTDLRDDEKLYVDPNSTLAAALRLEEYEKLVPNHEIFSGKIVSIGWNFFIRDCPALEELAQELYVYGHFHIENCPSLRHLPKKMAAEYMLVTLENLVSLPEHLYLKSAATFYNCEHLEYVPKEIVAGKSVNFEKVKDTSCFPDGFTTSNNLCLSGEFDSLPEAMYIGRDFYLSSNNLTHIPNGLHVGRDLILEYCPKLEYIANIKHVQGRIVVRDCPNLKTLPRNTKIVYQ